MAFDATGRRDLDPGDPVRPCRAWRGALAAAALATSGGLALAADAPPPAETLKVPDGWQLAWHDEFDVDGLPDPRKWANDTAFNRTGLVQPRGAVLLGAARRERGRA